MSQVKTSTDEVSLQAISETVIALARTASLEANVHDASQIDKCVALITPGSRMYVSHLPNQRWEETITTSVAVNHAGCVPVPHIPIRLIENDHALHTLLNALATQAHIEEVLLISGDYPQSRGPYTAVIEVLRNFPFADYGIKTVSLAGHPEGHPRVALEVIRDAEREKCIVATERGLICRTVTQFFFEADPFVSWSQNQIHDNLPTQHIAGIAGPASIASLFKFALRCGVGPSMRALGTRPGSLLKLIGDYTPDSLVCELAKAKLRQPTVADGLHLFCFGGLMRTCKWLQAATQGQFKFDADNRLHVRI